MNLLSLTAIVSLVAYIPIEIALGLEEGVWVNGGLQVVSLLGLWLVSRGYYYFTLRFISVIFIVYFPFAALFYGDGFGVEYLLIVTVINAFLFFEGAERFFWFAMACTTFFATDALQIYIPPYPHGAQPDLFYWMNLAIVFGVVGAAVNYFKMSTYNYLNVIKDQGHQLTEANEELNATLGALNQAHEEVKSTLELVSEQKEEIALANAHVMESIHYAQRIQLALLPPADLFSAALPSAFVYYRPKDIVSGDCYFLAQRNGQVILAAIDCTGHGVPGAFMSVMANSLFNEAVKESEGPVSPSALLSSVDAKVRRALRQDAGSAALDGMDVALLVLNPESPEGPRKAVFAGAGRPLCFSADSLWAEIPGNRFAVGGRSEGKKEFVETEIELKPGQWLFLFSDGVTDQFGGPAGRKYTRTRLRDFLLAHSTLPPYLLNEVLASELSRWQGSRPQLDDQLLIGIQI